MTFFFFYFNLIGSPIGGYCLNNNWCVGRSLCLNKACKCKGLKRYGLQYDDPDAYCGNSKIIYISYILYTNFDFYYYEIYYGFSYIVAVSFIG